MPADRPAPPVARRVPHSYTRHGVTIEDPYAWLRDPGYPQVTESEILAYLNAENVYFESGIEPRIDCVVVIFRLPSPLSCAV